MDPKKVRIIAIVVVVVVVVAGIGVYYYVSTRSNSCSLSSKNPLILDQPEKPDSLDPSVVFTTPGWGITQQVYQNLVMYNGSQYNALNSTTFDGELAKNWSHDATSTHWNFTMWPGEHFSNGDPINAYVMWWSLYRGLVMAQPIVFLLDENFYVPNETYYSNLSAIQAENASLNTTLNEFNTLQNVTNPGAPLLSTMEAPNQSFRVLNNLTLEFTVGTGYLGVTSYPFLLDQIASPPFSATDPLTVLAPGHGGLWLAAPNPWMSSNMLGSGPFTLTSYNPSVGYTLAPDPTYWAKNLAATEPWNNAIQPAKTSIEIDFQSDVAVDVNNLKTGSAAVASFAYVGPSTISDLQGAKCVAVTGLSPVYGGVSASWWVYMDQYQTPFNNLSVREAVVHAIDYRTIIQTAYSGNAQQWVGPVPPGYPDYNPSNLVPYQYNLTLAKAEMAKSPWPSGYPKALNFEYINVGPDLSVAAQLIKSELAQIGINLNLVGINLQQLATEQVPDPATGVCPTEESTNGGPFPIGEDYYTADYVSPDDATQLNTLSFGSYNWCMSRYGNATTDGSVYTALATTNPTQASQDYANITNAMYYNYTDAWLFVPTAFSVHSTLLQGVVSNPMGSALPFTMIMNTEYSS